MKCREDYYLMHVLCARRGPINIMALRVLVLFLLKAVGYKGFCGGCKEDASYSRQANKNARFLLGLHLKVFLF